MSESSTQFAAELLGPSNNVISDEDDEDLDLASIGDKSSEGDSEGTESTDSGATGVEALLGNLSDEQLREILKHPKVAPVVNSYADRVANQRITSELSIREAEVEARLRDQLLDQYFTSLGQEDLGQVLANDKDMAADFGRIQESKRANAPLTLTADEIQNRAEVESAKVTIRTNMGLLADSGLPDEIKTTLNPANYYQRGMAGLSDWTGDIYKAMVKFESSKTNESEVSERLEAERNNQQAERDSKLAGASMTKGRVVDKLPEIGSKSGAELLELAFSRRSNK